MNTFLLITKSSKGKQQKTNKRSEPRLGFKGFFALGRTKNVHVQQEKLTLQVTHFNFVWLHHHLQLCIMTYIKEIHKGFLKNIGSPRTGGTAPLTQILMRLRQDLAFKASLSYKESRPDWATQ